jgi:hypothetical protein
VRQVALLVKIDAQLRERRSCVQVVVEARRDPMSTTTFSRELERLRYWQGQTLRSRDYRDQARFDARRRQLHNRALHSTDGIAFGLAVTKISANPLRLKVDCGVAYDCYGRELVLQLPREIDAPAEASLLILRYRTASAGSSCCAPPDLGCAPDDAMMLDRDVELAWLAVASFERVAGVVLARSTGADLDASFARRQARPIARPRLARGETVRGNTPWEPWAIDVPDGQGGLTRTVVGVQTKIAYSTSTWCAPDATSDRGRKQTLPQVASQPSTTSSSDRT